MSEALDLNDWKGTAKRYMNVKDSGGRELRELHTQGSKQFQAMYGYSLFAFFSIGLGAYSLGKWNKKRQAKAQREAAQTPPASPAPPATLAPVAAAAPPPPTSPVVEAAEVALIGAKVEREAVQTPPAPPPAAAAPTSTVAEAAEVALIGATASTD